MKNWKLFNWKIHWLFPLSPFLPSYHITIKHKVCDLPKEYVFQDNKYFMRNQIVMKGDVQNTESDDTSWLCPWKYEYGFDISFQDKVGVQIDLKSTTLWKLCIWETHPLFCSHNESKIQLCGNGKQKKQYSWQEKCAWLVTMLINLESISHFRMDS